MNVEYINPFLETAKNIFKQMCNIDISKGNLILKNGKILSNEIRFIIGITGDVSGNVAFNMDKKTALKISSLMMMGMPITEFNDLSRSALAEMSNMIAGNSSIHFLTMGKTINITPPMMIEGKNSVVYQDATICVPIIIDTDCIMEVDICLK